VERGARALDNPRSKTGEPSLDKRSSILEELKAGGRESAVFRTLQGKYFLKIYPLNYSYISYEFHFAPETSLGEVRIRSLRILIGLGLTWFTRYWFPEELISPLAKPFLTLPLDSYFVRTQSTEASPTYVATSSIACSYFVFPLISHQIWCFLIPSCYGEQRTKYNRFLHLSGSRFSLFLFLTLSRVVPNVWHFPYFMGATSTNSLMIKLQPKIYDHIMLTVRISFIPSVCSQVPVIVIRLPEPRALSVETSTNNRRFLMVFPLLTAALSTPPDIWCQIVARFLISSIIELAISVASIVQVREEGWTSGMRESGSIDKKEE
jgi:Tat protein translocase TatC